MTEFSRRTLGKGAFGVSLLGLMGAAAGCTTQGQSPTTTNPDGSVSAGTLTVGFGFDPAPLNPVTGAAALAAQFFYQAVYDNLLRVEEDGTVVPNLAEGFEPNDDNTRFTVTLREGVTFSDGEPLNAQAYATFIDAAKNGTGANSRDAAGLTVEVTDDLTFDIVCAEPNAKVAELLANAMGAVPSPQQLASANADTKPVGAGPYLYDASRSTSGDTYTFTKKADYWNADAYPYDTLVMKVIQDATARLNALKTNQIQSGEVTAQQVREAEASNLTLLRETGNFLGFIIADREGTLVPALADVRVRQAICMAFDRQVIIDNAVAGEGVAGNQIFPEGMAGHRADKEDLYPFDVEGAKALLAEAGYPQGFEVEIPFIEGITPHNPIIITQLGEIGITVNQVTVPISNAFSEVLGGRFPIVPGVGIATPVAVLNEIIAPTAVWNMFHVSDPELDAMVARAQSTAGEAQEQAFDDIGGHVLDNAYYCVWGHAYGIHAVTQGTTAEMRRGFSSPVLRSFRPS